MSNQILSVNTNDSNTVCLIISAQSGENHCQNLLDCADSILDVGHEPVAGLEKSTNYHHHQCNGKLIRCLNIGISMSRDDWVVVLFGDEVLGSNWLTELQDQISNCLSCALFFYPKEGNGPPLAVIRREAFIYGSLDERFMAPRLVALHWRYSIYSRASRQISVCDNIEDKRVEWLSSGWPQQLTGAMAALIEFGVYLDWHTRVVLLDMCNIDYKDNLSTLLKQYRQYAGIENVNPYFDTSTSTSYSPQTFWTDNTTDYLRWEVFNPDEAEIVALVNLARPQRVLELGCGAGRNISFFSESEAYVGLDIVKSLLHRARERLLANKVGLVCGDAANLGFANDSFDLVFADSTIQHIAPDKIKNCIAELARVSSRYVCLIEHTEELDSSGNWFDQIHLFSHDYVRLFNRHGSLVAHGDCALLAQPARKEFFLFEIFD